MRRNLLPPPPFKFRKMPNQTRHPLSNKFLALLAAALLLGSPAAASAAQDDGEWGDLVGKIQVVGKPVPSAEKLQVTKDLEFCGKHDLKDESLQVSEAGGLKNVFVYLYQSRREQQTPKIHPSYDSQSTEPVTLDNVNCRFAPHVLTFRTSQPMIAKNSDEVGHNANVESRNNPGLNPQIPAGQQEKLALETPEREPVKVSCGSHAWMSAYVLAREEPYMALTDENGSFKIPKLPAGEWTFQFWHERTRAMSDLTRDGKEMTDRRGNLTVTIEAGKTTDLGTLQIKLEELTD